MEIGKLPVSLPSIVKINNELAEVIVNSIKDDRRVILNDIAERYQIKRNELFELYAKIDINVANITKQIKPKRNRKEVPIKERCYAKTSNGKQCSRRKNKENFCGGHYGSRPYGEFTEEQILKLAEQEETKELLVRKKPVIIAKNKPT